MSFVPESFAASAGTMTACGTASLYLNSGSGAVRLIVTVPVPRVRAHTALSVQVAGLAMHALAPTMPAQCRTGLLTLKMRWNEATTSAGVTVLPFENLIPLRSLKTHVLPPLVGAGTRSQRPGRPRTPRRRPPS